MDAPPHRLDRHAFLELYRQTAEPLRRYALRALGNAAAADDVVQETFARALASANFPAREDEARAYLFRVSSNLMADHWRRMRRERGRQDAIEEALIEDTSLRMDLARLFAQLKLRDRQLIWLAHVEGVDHTRIAFTLGVSAGSVKVLLHRARTKFAALLRAGGYGQEERS